MISVAISTVNRPGNYVHRVIAGLRKDLRIKLIVGSPHYRYVRRYQNEPRVEIVGTPPAEWKRFKDCSVMHRASWNYWRCLVYGVRSGAHSPKGLLILEDDVQPAADWEARLHATIRQIENQYGEEYVLTLYTCYDRLSQQVVEGKLYSPYPAARFWGTQAMYYPDAMRRAFADYLKREGVETIRMPYDHLLSEYLRFTGIPLFATTPCLFEHIGRITTGLSPFFHRAGCFVRRRQPRKASL